MANKWVIFYDWGLRNLGNDNHNLNGGIKDGDIFECVLDYEKLKFKVSICREGLLQFKKEGPEYCSIFEAEIRPFQAYFPFVQGFMTEWLDYSVMSI